MSEEELKTVGVEGIGLDRELLIAAFKGKAETNQAKMEVDLKRKDGSSYAAEVSVSSFIDCDDVTKIMLRVRDISQHKKDEKSLEESEEKYRFLFQNMLNGFAYCKIITNSNGEPEDFEYIEVNDAFEQITGLKKTDVAGKRATEAIEGIKEAHPELFAIYGRVALTGKTEKFLIYFKPLQIWLSITAYCPKKGYFVAVFENVTEQKQNEKKLEEYSEGLEFTIAARTEELSNVNDRLLKAERFAAIGELAGMVGHDLRNPLTAIKNAVYYLDRKQGPSMDAKTKEMFKVINNSVEHANKIIGNLLEYSKEISLEIEEATPKSLLDYILLMIQIPPHIKIHDRTQDSPTIWVDSNKIERVFINLIKNAIDAMPEGGTLEIRSRHVGDEVEFIFADTGTGMTEQTKTKIFMPLFTTKAQGMGFGLAICKRIVDAHGGRITVESTLGKGTTFTVALPVEQKLKIKDEETLMQQDFCDALQS
jgi:PAS domain S-box-containing protein